MEIPHLTYDTLHNVTRRLVRIASGRHYKQHDTVVIEGVYYFGKPGSAFRLPTVIEYDGFLRYFARLHSTTWT